MAVIKAHKRVTESVHSWFDFLWIVLCQTPEGRPLRKALDIWEAKLGWLPGNMKDAMWKGVFFFQKAPSTVQVKCLQENVTFSKRQELLESFHGQAAYVLDNYIICC